MIIKTPLDEFYISEAYTAKTSQTPYSFYVTLKHKSLPITIAEKVESENTLTEIEKSNCVLTIIRHLILASRFGIIGEDEKQYLWDQGLNKWYDPSKLPEDD